MGIQELTGCRRCVLWSAIAISVFLHLLAVWCWRQSFTSAPFNKADAPLEIRLLTPSPPSMQVEPKTIYQRLQPRVGQPARNDGGDAERPAQNPSAAAPPAGLTQSPAPNADQMILEAKRDIGKIDRELRQAFPASPGMAGKPGGTALERGIAAAGLPHGTVTREVILADGRRMTKVSTPSGAYCILGHRPGAGMEENERAAFTTTTCPD